jgi:hypothetical protein
VHGGRSSRRTRLLVDAKQRVRCDLIARPLAPRAPFNSTERREVHGRLQRLRSSPAIERCAKRNYRKPAK